MSVTHIKVEGAATDADARVVAKSVAGSSLAKAAIFGGDPNWGRIAAAAGYSGEIEIENERERRGRRREDDGWMDGWMDEGGA